MLNFTPVLSSINQVFSLETLNELDRLFDKNEQTNFLKSDWGQDRVVSLRSRDSSVKSQWNGTCTSFATIAAIENRLGNNENLSERSLWDAYGVYSTKEAIQTAQIHFILEERYWPQHQSTFDPRYKGKGRYKISSFEYLSINYQKVLHAIDNGNVCIVAVATPKDLLNGNIQVEASSEFKKGSGHAMCVSGYKVENGKGYFLVKNSWGVNNGDNGYQYVSFDLFNRNKSEYAIFWEIKAIEDRGEQSFNIFLEETTLLSDNYQELNSFLNSNI